MVQGVLGGLVGAAWLALPWVTAGAGNPGAAAGTGRAPVLPAAEGPAGADGGEPGTADLLPPFVTAGGAGVLASYACVRRRRRARTRTVPDGAAAGRPPRDGPCGGPYAGGDAGDRLGTGPAAGRRGHR
ncbi:hypothetical protein GCM10010358_09120 [Streptomyces minutiscleroticus]|uniref:Uncharacterized protein n=1 Tax=Streptomyces minutiscleroticus TaxID=68238 RepID=A0A918NBY3_9ACTN|nr:hypothetical protein GCM10010358_09120 [Streptomyces minutiscleroticus]